jgi:hypothetical protein
MPQAEDSSELSATSGTRSPPLRIFADIIIAVATVVSDIDRTGGRMRLKGAGGTSAALAEDVKSGVNGVTATGSHQPQRAGKKMGEV